MNLSQLQKADQKAEIVKVEIGKMENFIDPKYHRAFDRASLERTVIHVVAVCDDELKTEVRENFNIPSTAGFLKSNLSSFQEVNGLPNETDEWVGKSVQVGRKEKEETVFLGFIYPSKKDVPA